MIDSCLSKFDSDPLPTTASEPAPGSRSVLTASHSKAFSACPMMLCAGQGPSQGHLAFQRMQRNIRRPVLLRHRHLAALCGQVTRLGAVAGSVMLCGSRLVSSFMGSSTPKVAATATRRQRRKRCRGMRPFLKLHSWHREWNAVSQFRGLDRRALPLPLAGKYDGPALDE